MKHNQREIAALRRRARKTDAPINAVEGFINSLSLYEGYISVTNGNAWDAPWILARANDAILMRDGSIYHDIQDVMNAYPTFKRRLMQKFMGDK